MREHVAVCEGPLSRLAIEGGFVAESPHCLDLEASPSRHHLHDHLADRRIPLTNLRVDFHDRESQSSRPRCRVSENRELSLALHCASHVRIEVCGKPVFQPRAPVFLRLSLLRDTRQGGARADCEIRLNKVFTETGARAEPRELLTEPVPTWGDSGLCRKDRLGILHSADRGKPDRKAGTQSHRSTARSYDSGVASTAQDYFDPRQRR